MTSRWREATSVFCSIQVILNSHTLFSGLDLPEGQQFIVMDNNAKTYQRMKHEPKPNELEEEIDFLMSSDIIDASMSTKPITFNRLQSGWFFRQDKSVSIITVV